MLFSNCSESNFFCPISHLVIISLAVLVAVGSSLDPGNKKAEKFENGVWTDIQDAPVNKSLSAYAVIFDSSNFYYFGGLDNGDAVNSILRLNAETWTWTKVGTLNNARNGHGVISAGNTFMVIGGYSGSFPNEQCSCQLNNGQFTCEATSSSLTDYKHYPLLSLVDNSYKNC